MPPAFTDAFSNETNAAYAAAQFGAGTTTPVDPNAAKYGQAGNGFLTVMQTLLQANILKYPSLQKLLDVVNQAQDNYNSGAQSDPGIYGTASGVQALLQDFNNGVAALLNIWLPTTGTDYGLLLGGENGLLTLINNVQDALDSVPGGSILAPFIDLVSKSLQYAITHSINFNSITHDRLLVPTTGAAFLDFDLFLPVISEASSSITVTITPDDNGVVGRLDGYQVATTFSKTFTVNPAFFVTKTYAMAVDPSLVGHMVTITFTQNGFDDDQILGANAGGKIGLVPAGQQALSQIYFLDNVTFSAKDNSSPQQVGVVSAASTLGTTNPDLTLTEVAQTAAEAEQYWIDSGLFPNAKGALDPIQIVVGQLSDNTIGDYANNIITIDANAAGVGWYTGLDNSEFTAGPDGTYTAVAGTDAAQHFDLLTVLEHEYGHVLGIGDFADGSVPGALMNVNLDEGVRIFPSSKGHRHPRGAGQSARRHAGGSPARRHVRAVGRGVRRRGECGRGNTGRSAVVRAAGQRHVHRHRPGGGRVRLDHRRHGHRHHGPRDAH